MTLTRRHWLVAVAAALLVLYAGFATAVSVSNGDGTKHVTIVAGTHTDGRMYYACDAPSSTAGTCKDVDSHATVTVHKRDRVSVTVRTDDGRSHSHDFRLEGAPYLLWPAGIEMELKKPSETKSFTAWKAGEFRFICELKGHEDRGMWGTLIVS